MSQLNNLDKKINLLNKRKELKNLLKKYNKKLEKINKKIKLKLLHENEKKLIYIESQKSDVICEYEKPMPLIYNKITEQNLNKEKSYIQTKKLIHKINKRKIKIKHEVVKDDILNIKIPNFNEKETYISNDYNINIDGIIVKEEIEIPPFYYTDIPPLEHVY